MSGDLVIERFPDLGMDELVDLYGSVGWTAYTKVVQDVLVRPDAQRSGVGRALVLRAFEPYASVRQKVLLTDDEPGH